MCVYGVLYYTQRDVTLLLHLQSVVLLRKAEWTRPLSVSNRSATKVKAQKPSIRILKGINPRRAIINSQRVFNKLAIWHRWQLGSSPVSQAASRNRRYPVSVEDLQYVRSLVRLNGHPAEKVLNSINAVLYSQTQSWPASRFDKNDQRLCCVVAVALVLRSIAQLTLYVIPFFILVTAREFTDLLAQTLESRLNEKDHDVELVSTAQQLFCPRALGIWIPNSGIIDYPTFPLPKTMSLWWRRMAIYDFLSAEEIARVSQQQPF